MRIARQPKGRKKHAGNPLADYVIAQEKSKFAAKKKKRKKKKKKKLSAADDEEREMAAAGIMKNDNHERALAVEEGHVYASDVSSAVAQITLTTGRVKVDRHPEKRQKAAYMAFFERQLPILRQDCPGLKRSQYNEKIVKMWKKSHENPMNAPQKKFT